MEQRHTVNQQQHVTTSVTCQRVRGLESRLAHNLVATLARTNFLRVIDLQIDLLTQIISILRIVTFDTDVTSVNLSVDLVGRVPSVHLVNDLLHLRGRQRTVA